MKKVDSISYRALILRTPQGEIPVFNTNTYAYINTKPTGGNKTINAGIQEKTKQVIHEYMSKLSFGSRLKMRNYVNKNRILNQDSVCFISSEGDTAFVPKINILNALIGLVKKYNCIDILETMLYYFGDVFIMEPNKKINSDIFAYVRNSDPDELSFEWNYVWTIDLVQR